MMVRKVHAVAEAVRHVQKHREDSQGFHGILESGVHLYRTMKDSEQHAHNHKHND
jgi:hypothetical protein